MAKKFGDDMYYDGHQQQTQFGHKHSGHRYVSCFENHKPLELGGGVFIGGSCSRPVTDSADVYIGFDRSMSVREALPWDRQIVQVLYPITDMHSPSDSKSFIKLIDWSAEQLHDGKTLHAGCIGGHGRTGTFLAALWAVINQDKHAIEAVRKAYCHKAVESSVQVQFLVNHFGLHKVDGAKENRFSGRHGGWNNMPDYPSNIAKFPSKGGGREFKSSKSDGLMFKNAQQVFNPVKSSTCVFGSLF